MTAYARVTEALEQGEIAWELRSVNHRYLELGPRLPEELRALEPAVRERTAARVKRGKLDLVLTYIPAEGRAPAPELDTGLLDRLVDIKQRVARKMGQASPSDPVALMRWPGLLREPGADLEPLHDAVLELLDRALDELVTAREREGARLAEGMRSRAAGIRGHATSVRERIPRVLAAIHGRMKERIEALDVEADPERLEQELALVAQRMDVTEELERLESHADELESALERDEPVGRRLDFLMQEFNREANTLASKSQDTETSKAAVEMKVLVEQMREQVQNVE